MATKTYKRRRAQGLCVDCAKPLEDKTRCRCEKCRLRNNFMHSKRPDGTPVIHKPVVKEKDPDRLTIDKLNDIGVANLCAMIFKQFRNEYISDYKHYLMMLKARGKRSEETIKYRKRVEYLEDVAKNDTFIQSIVIAENVSADGILFTIRNNLNKDIHYYDEEKEEEENERNGQQEEADI